MQRAPGTRASSVYFEYCLAHGLLLSTPSELRSKNSGHR